MANTFPAKLAFSMENTFGKNVLADKVEAHASQADGKYILQARVYGSLVLRQDVTHWLKNAFGIILPEDDITIRKEPDCTWVTFSIPC